MLWLEMSLVLRAMALPDWLLPESTPHEIITTLHRLFPAFMSGCRCIISSFYVDLKERRLQVLDPLIAVCNTNLNTLSNVVYLQLDSMSHLTDLLGKSKVSAVGNGLMNQAINTMRCQPDSSAEKTVEAKIKQMKHPHAADGSTDTDMSLVQIITNFTIYYVVRQVILKVMAVKVAAE